MEIQVATILSITIYKIVSLLVGLCFSYMGYKLFMSGVLGHAGELDAKLGDNKVVLKQAAPGTFFVLFGTVVIAFTIIKGIDVKSKHAELNSQQASTSISESNLPNERQLTVLQDTLYEQEISAVMNAPEVVRDAPELEILPIQDEKEVFSAKEPLK